MTTPQRLLLIEDNRTIVNALGVALRHNYIIEAASTGKLGLYKAESDYDAIILDLGLPDMPGLAVCRRLRERGCLTPIIILTAEDKVLSKISLLDAGANDYLCKPFSLGELKARLRALTRPRDEVPGASGQLIVGNLILDRAAYQVQRGDQIIPLRRKEFALLECLMKHAGSVVSRDMLIRHAWQGTDSPWTNTVDVHIKYLRDKIDRPYSSQLIKTVHGVGYCLEAMAKEASCAAA